MYRAMESERSDALFHDPWARKLAGPEGEAILRGVPKGAAMAWPMIVRTQVMDEILLRTIREEKVDAVLNLAAGLDARPFRLPLPPALRWIEVDFPDILAYKQSVLGAEKPHCTLEFTPADLTDGAARGALFAQVGASASRVFVIAEGLLGYLQAEQVARLAQDLSARPSFRWWLIDLASPDLLKRIQKLWGKTLQKTPLIFGPVEGTQFFDPHGWRELEYRQMFLESLRLNRTMRFAKFFKMLGHLYPKKTKERFSRFSGIVLMGRKS